MYSAKILVITEGLEDSLVLFLESISDFRVLEVTDGKEAFARINKEYVDLVVVSECASPVDHDCGLIKSLKRYNDQFWIVVIGNKPEDRQVFMILAWEGADTYFDRSKIKHHEIVARIRAGMRRLRDTRTATLLEDVLLGA